MQNPTDINCLTCLLFWRWNHVQNCVFNVFFARFIRDFTEKNIPSQNNARSRLTSSRGDRKQDVFVMRSPPCHPDPSCLLITAIFVLVIFLSDPVKVLHFGKILRKGALLCCLKRCWSTNGLREINGVLLPSADQKLQVQLVYLSCSSVIFYLNKEH